MLQVIVHKITAASLFEDPSIVARCPETGAYLRKSRAQYTLIVEQPFTKKQWSRHKVNFAMALARANEVLAHIQEEKNDETAQTAR